MLAYITAYLKAHYPVEYMAPLISSYINRDKDSIIQYINDLAVMNIKILPPDINKSGVEFLVEGNDIRYGLASIRDITQTSIYISKWKSIFGEFKSLEQFILVSSELKINKKSIYALTLSGALDCLFAKDLQQTITVPVYNKSTKQNEPTTFVIPEVVRVEDKIDRIKVLEFLSLIRGSDNSEVDDGIEKIVQLEADPNVKKKYGKLLDEPEIKAKMTNYLLEVYFLGLSLSTHPLEGKISVANWGTHYSRERFSITAMLLSTKEIKTKKGDDMAFLTLETIDGQHDAVIFPKEYANLKKKVEDSGLRNFTLESDYKDGKVSYIVKNIVYYK